MSEANLEAIFSDPRLRRFSDRQRVAAGGFGAVYCLTDPTTGSKKALKVQLAGRAGERFQREVEILGELDHPSIVRVDCAELHGPLLWMLMEWCEGGTLEARVQAGFGRESIAEVVEVFIELANALVEVHESGFAHRDLKPQNILFSRDEYGEERAVIVDFGLAQQRGGQSLTTTGESIGTMAFASPEQLEVRGAYGETGPASDVWGLAATLYFCLTGASPFERATVVETASAILNGTSPDLRSERGQVPRWLSRLIAEALQKQPAARPSMEDFRDRLLEGLQSGGRSSPRAPWIWASAALLCSILSAFYFLSPFPDDAPSVERPSAPDKPPGPAVKTPEPLRRPPEIALPSWLAQERRYLEAGVRLVGMTLREVLGTAAGSNPRACRCLALGFEDRVAAVGCEDGAVRLFDCETGLERIAFGDPGTEVHALSFVPGEARLLVADNAGVLSIWNLERGVEREARLGVHDGPVTGFRFSVDAKDLLVYGPTRAVLWNWRERKAWPKPADGLVWGLGTNDCVVLESNDIISAQGPQLLIWSPKTRRARQRISLRSSDLEFDPVLCMAAAGEDRLFLGFRSGELGRYFLRQAKLDQTPSIEPPESSRRSILSIARLGDQSLLTGSESGNIAQWDLELKPIAQMIAHHGAVRALAASGTEFFSIGDDRRFRRWKTFGAPAWPLAGHSGPITGLLAMPQIIMSIGEDGLLLTWSPGEKRPGLLKTSPGSFSGLILSSNQRHLAYFESGRGLRVIDLTSKVERELKIQKITPKAYALADSLIFMVDGSHRLYNATLTPLDQPLGELQTLEINGLELTAVTIADGGIPVLGSQSGLLCALVQRAEGVKLVELGRLREAVSVVAASNGLALIVGGGQDGELQALRHEQVLWRSAGRDSPVQAISFEEDLKLVAVAWKNGLARVFDSERGTLLAEVALPEGQDEFHSLGFNDNGKTLIVGSARGLLRFFTISQR